MDDPRRRRRDGTTVALGGFLPTPIDLPIHQSRLPALESASLRDYAPQFALVALLLAEIVFLSMAFDTGDLDSVSSLWAQLIGQAPQYLRLAITITLTTILLAGRQLPVGLVDFRAHTTLASRLPYLAAHGCALLAFAQLTAAILGGSPIFATHPAATSLTWLLSGLTALAAWSLALFPRRIWIAAASHWQSQLGWGVVIGASIWASGLAAERLWLPMAGYTFNVVQWLLATIYPETVSSAAQLMVGTPRFNVVVLPECSGIEGVGLILAFLIVYLYLFRNDLRFPGALVLLPLGAVAIWLVNALRIVALVAIGSAGWPAVAKGGFHSQAGWIAFNAVGLGFVALMNQRRYFMTPAASRPASADESDATPAYLAPFAAVIATAMITGAFSAGFDWLYPLRIVSAGAAVWAFRRQYADLRWAPSWQAVGIGAVTFAVWLALLPQGPGDKDAWPAVLASVPSGRAAAWMLLRVVGYVTVIPLAEELAFRGYLTRRLRRADFQALPVGVFSWGSFLLSSALFGAFHGRLWLPGMAAGLLFAAALYRRRSLGDAVCAHATTNGLLALYALVTGHWSVWS